MYPSSGRNFCLEIFNLTHCPPMCTVVVPSVDVLSCWNSMCLYNQSVHVPMLTTFIYHETPLVSEECRACSGMAVWPLYARECGTRRSSSWHPWYTEASDNVNSETPSTHPSHSSYGSCGLCRRCSASSFYWDWVPLCVIRRHNLGTQGNFGYP